MQKIETLIIPQPDIEKIKQNDFAPELLPAIQKPKEIQELRKIEEADNKDIQDWIDTAVEMLPEISTEI